MLRKKGIQKVMVFGVSQKAKITYNGSLVSEDDIMQRISQLGYKATILHESTSPYETTLVIPLKQQNHKEQEDSGGTGSAINIDSALIEECLLVMSGVKSVSIVYLTAIADHQDKKQQQQNKNRKKKKEPVLHVRVQYDPDVTGARYMIAALHKSLGIEASLMPSNMSMRKTTSRGADVMRWKRAFIASSVLAVPVFLLSFIASLLPDVAHEAVMYKPWNVLPPVLSIVELLLTTPVQFIIAWPLYVSSFKSLRMFRLNMDVLVVLSTLTAYLYSVVAMVLAVVLPSYDVEFFFETSAVLLALVLLGRYLEAAALGSTSSALKKLLSLQVDMATLLELAEERNSIMSTSDDKAETSEATTRMEEELMTVANEQDAADVVGRRYSTRSDRSALISSSATIFSK